MHEAPERVIAKEKIQNNDDGVGINQQLFSQMLSITTGRQYIPTEGQVDKILALQERGMDYTHKERTVFLPKDLLQYGLYLMIVVSVIGVFIFSAFYAKEYLDVIASGMMGLIAGSVGGYGVGYSGKNRRNEDL